MAIELSELVGELRRELYKSMMIAGDAPLRFELGSIELQVQFTASRTAGAGGKIRFLVAEAGAEGQSSHSTVQSVKLSLTPQFTDSDVKPWISDAPGPDER